MKKLKKHVMILCLFLLLGIMALVISFNASAIGRMFLPASSGKVTVSSAPTSSSGAKSQSYTQADLFPAQIGNSDTSVINSKSKSNAPTLSDSDTDVSQTETDTSGWNNKGNLTGESGITVTPISESAPVKSPSKPVPKPAPKPSPAKPKPSPTKPQPVTPTTPQPNPQSTPTPQPVTPIQPTGGGSSNGGGSSRVVKITAVNLNKTGLTLKKGEAAALTASVSPDNTTQSKTVTWSSSNEKVATVDSTGKVTAVEGGSTKITAKASNGVTGVCNVSVTVAATKIALNLTNIDLEKGDSRVLTPTVSPTDSTDSVSWATSNNDIGAVDNTGKITAVASGTATITATVGTVSASCKVTVGISITQLKLSDTDITIKKGESHALTATINPPDTTEDKAVTWTTSDDKVAKVDKDGKITGIENGTAIITAQAGIHTAQCTVHVLVSATGITLDKNEINVERGSSQTLTAKIAPDDTTVTNVDWVSTDETIATVDNKGKVTGISTGSTVITVKSRDGGFTAHCTVHVVVSITGVHLNDSSLTLKKGDSHALVGIVLPADTTEDKTIKWTSSNTAVANVDNSGNIMAVEGGTAVITAQVGTHTAQCTVTVIVPVTGISFESSDISVEKGASQTLTPVFTPSDATDKAVTWTSSNDAVATVDPSGMVSTLTPGVTTITATSHDGEFKATCTVHVVISIKGIALSDKSLTLNKGGSKALTVTIDPPDTTEDKTVHWTSSNPAAATIDRFGKVTAVEGGTSVITAAVGKYTVTCNITVVVPVTGISLSQTSLKLAKGTGATLTATLQPADATDKGISWTSSNPNIVTVDTSGKLQAVAVGQATITATSHDGGFRANCTVSVVIPVTGIRLDQSSLTLRKGSTSKLTATVSPSDATDKAVSWATSNPGVATVDGSGNITAVNGGTAIITATSHDGGYKAQCAINVPIPVTGISLNKTADTMKAGSTDTLVATVIPSDAVDKAVVWSSSNPSVATVDQNGRVIAVGSGKANITAASHDGGYISSCSVTVPVTWTYATSLNNHNSAETENYGVDSNTSLYISIKSEGATPSHTVSAEAYATYTFRDPLSIRAGDTVSYKVYPTYGVTDAGGRADVSAPSYSPIFQASADVNNNVMAEGVYTFSADTQIQTISMSAGADIPWYNQDGDARVQLTIHSSNYGSFLLNNTGTSAQ